MRWNDIVWMVILIVMAGLISWLGGMTRTYSAFGGEDVLAICLIGYAIHSYIEAGKGEEE